MIRVSTKVIAMVVAGTGPVRQVSTSWSTLRLRQPMSMSRPPSAGIAT